MGPRYIQLFALFALALLAALLPYGAAAQPGQPSAQFRVFLPSLQNGAPEPPPPPPPPPARGGVFPLHDPRTTSAAIAQDAAGGLHSAYIVYEPLNAQPPVYYAFCARGRNCLDPASWQQVILARNGEEVQLALGPAGQPRLLYRVTADSPDEHHYYYAACESRCAERASWASVKVAETTKTSATDWDMPQRSFALDRLGRPRFIYVTGGLGDPRKGAFYAYCDANCTRNDPSNPSWREMSLHSDILFYDPVLTFTSQNQPRVLATTYVQEEPVVTYLACDTGCESWRGWGRAFLIHSGYGPLASWDLELDAQDRPRVAIYQEGGDNNSGDVLIYGWCNSGCLDDEQWEGELVGLPQHDGETPDLELDGQGRPRIAYHAAGGAGLGYAWCDSACEGAAAAWESTILEASATLDESHPIVLPPACEAGAWVTGYQPMLSLDAQGNPLVASEAQRLLRCRYEDPETGEVETRVVSSRHARLVFADQP